MKGSNRSKSKNFQRSSKSNLESHVISNHEMEIDDRVKVKQLVDLLYDVLSVYGYRQTAPLSYSKIEKARYESLIRADKDRHFMSFYSYVCRAGFGSWKDLFKYKINSFFSYVFRQEIPKAPEFIEEFPDLQEPSSLFYGRAKRFLRSMKKNQRKLKSFTQSIAQCKKGAPPVHRLKVKEACKSTFLKLTTEPVQIEDFNIEDFYMEGGVHWSQPINKAVICGELRRTVREVFAKVKLTPEDVYEPFFPSPNSNYNFSRKENGAVGALYEKFPKYFCIGESLIKKRIDDVKIYGRKVSQYGALGREEELEIRDFEFEHGFEFRSTLGILYNEEDLYVRWREFYDELVEAAMEELPVAKCIGLPEPLKVRVITAGPPLTYSVLKPIQKWLWRSIKHIKVFELVGTPITKEFITEKIGKLGLNEVFVSGDYVASTDNLHSWVSQELLSELILMLHENGDLNPVFINQLRALMGSALTGHLIAKPDEYSPGTRTGIPGVSDDKTRSDALKSEQLETQKEGQLMGSIISFPFLCLANAALCRFAMEISEKKTYKIVDDDVPGHIAIPLGINGDDCVFKGTKGRIFEIWKQVTAFAGLASSVGKTFVSREFLTMNSVQFEYIEESGLGWEDEYISWSYEEQKYCNMALVYGQEKSGIREKNACTLGSLHRELKKSCPTEYFEKASELFIREHRKKLNESCVPWFIPEWLGGRGLEPFGKLKASKFDRLISTRIRSKMGGVNEALIPIKCSESSEWKMHQLVKKDNEDFNFLGNQFFTSINYDGTDRTLESEDARFYKCCVIDLLFTKGLNELKKVLKDGHAQLAYAENHNAKMWKLHTDYVLKRKPKLVPMTHEELCYERRVGFLPSFSERI